MTSVVVLIVMTAVSLCSWYLVSARRRREDRRSVSEQWLSDRKYPKDGDRPR